MKGKSITMQRSSKVTRKISTAITEFRPGRTIPWAAHLLTASLLFAMATVAPRAAHSDGIEARRLGSSVLLSSAESTFAENSSPEVGASMIPSSARLLSAGIIAAGMTFQQVLKALGPAPEKVEYEASRGNVWHYTDGQVLFKEGRVVKIETPIVASALPATEAASLVVAPKVPKVSKEAERVLLEILKEIPSGSDGASDGGSGVPSPGTPLTPQALRMNPSMAPFGGISNAESLEDMVE